jgi:hypothetical protein
MEKVLSIVPLETTRLIWTDKITEVGTSHFVIVNFQQWCSWNLAPPFCFRTNAFLDIRLEPGQILK